METQFSKNLYTRLPYCVRRRLNQRHTLALVVVVVFACAAVLLVQVVLLVLLLTQQTPQRQQQTQPQPVAEARGSLLGGGGKLLSSKVVGVREEDVHKYLPDSEGTFTCFPSGLKIPFSLVNDDYCDCPQDGSDEPSTSACPAGSFHCARGDRDVPSSRVNDGVCDCCDGSDEWEGRIPDSFGHLTKEDQTKLGRFQVPCPEAC